MSGRSDRSGEFPIGPTETALAVGYLAVLVAGGAAIAISLGRPPGPFLADLFADPVWLFGTVFGLFLLLKGYQKRRDDETE